MFTMYVEEIFRKLHYKQGRQRDLRGDKVYKILTLVDLYFLKLRRDTLNSTIDKNRI